MVNSDVKRYSIIVVEHRPVKGVNRYAFGKFPDKRMASVVADEIIRYFGGNVFEGSKDVYVVPTKAATGYPRYDCGCDVLVETIPKYIKTAYDCSMDKCSFMLYLL